MDITGIFDDLFGLADKAWSRYIDFETQREDRKAGQAARSFQEQVLANQAAAQAGAGGAIWSKPVDWQTAAIVGAVAIGAFLWLRK